MEALQREIYLKDLLDEGLILDRMTNRTKKAAIEALVDLLYKRRRIGNKSEAIARVLEREDLATTALGEGVAIPHARVEVGERPVMAVGRHPAGLDFDAPDGKPVTIIALILWQPEQPGLFNRLFAGLVTRLADAGFRQSLIGARGPKEIAAILSGVRIDMGAGATTKCEADMLIALQLLESKRRAGAKGLTRQIELARAELPGSMLSRFDRLIDRYGEALVEAPDGVCTGCMSRLSTRFASEMLNNPDTVYVCEHCGRFIILRLAGGL